MCMVWVVRLSVLVVVVVFAHMVGSGMNAQRLHTLLVHSRYVVTVQVHFLEDVKNDGEGVSLLSVPAAATPSISPSAAARQ